MATKYPPGRLPVIESVAVMEIQARLGGESPFLGYTVVYQDGGGNTMGAVRNSQSFSPQAQELLRQLALQLEQDFVMISSTPLHDRDGENPFPEDKGVEFKAPH